MSRRFEYDLLSAGEFGARLSALSMPPHTFARVFGVRSDTVDAWLAGVKDIPPWVRTSTALLGLPNAFGRARTAAASMIRADSRRPGEPYPYLATRKDHP